MPVACKTAGLNNRDYSAQQKVAPEGAVVSYSGNFGATLPIIRAGPARQNRPPRADVILMMESAHTGKNGNPGVSEIMATKLDT